MLEALYRRTEIEVKLIIINDGTFKEIQRKKTRPERRIKKALEIKPSNIEGSMYTSVLGEIRQNIRPEELGVEINRIRKTKEGRIRVEVTERREDARHELGS